jgi:hypothetical protein
MKLSPGVKKEAIFGFGRGRIGHGFQVADSLRSKLLSEFGGVV